MQNDILFSTLLTQVIAMNFDSNLSVATTYLNENGCPINYQTMRYYVGNYTLPDYAKADLILTILKSPMDQQRLMDILEYSSKNLFDKPTDAKYFITSVRINPTNLDSDMSVVDFKNYVDERCIDIFGTSDKKGFTSYITYLIRKDMDENIDK